MIDPRKTLDEAIKLSLQPILGASGFKKKGRVFRKPTDNQTQILDVQLSRWNTHANVQFTINLGLFCPSISAYLKQPFTETPTTAHCPARVRVGELMSAGKDHWWEVLPDSRADDLAAELRFVSQSVLNWFEGMRTLEDAARFMKNRKFYYLAAVAFLQVGKRDEAMECVGLAIAEGKAMPTLLGWAAENSLI